MKNSRDREKGGRERERATIYIVTLHGRLKSGIGKKYHDM
jgi:hypothetical protein